MKLKEYYCHSQTCTCTHKKFKNINHPIYVEVQAGVDVAITVEIYKSINYKNLIFLAGDGDFKDIILEIKGNQMNY